MAPFERVVAGLTEVAWAIDPKMFSSQSEINS